MSEKARTYPIEFRCSNCFMIFKQDFTYGQTVRKETGWAVGYYVKAYSYIPCPNCGSIDISKTGNYLNGMVPKEEPT